MWMTTPAEPLIPAMQDIQMCRDIDIQTRQSLNQPCTLSNAFAFGVYYVILCGLLVTRPREPSMSLAMFAALRLSTFIGRCADFEPVGQVFTLAAHVHLVGVLIDPVVSMAASKVQARLEALLGACLMIALWASIGHVFTQMGSSGTSYAGGLVTTERIVQVYLGSLTLFLVIAAGCIIPAYQKRNRHITVVLMLLLALVAVPLVYLQVKQGIPGTRPYLQTEQVLFSCWYLPELFLVGLLWYAHHPDIWPTEAEDNCMDKKSLPFSVETKNLPVAQEKPVRYR